MTGAAVKTAFQPNLFVLPIPCIVPLKEVPSSLRKTPKYQQIAASLEHVGLIEPLVVFPIGKDQYWLLDGHVRLDILKTKQICEVKCLLATDDESYNYNRRVNFLPAIAEHHMILKALANGVSEQRIAAALNLDVASIRKKRSLLDGICPEAAALLKEKRVTANALSVLRKMRPIRQLEAAELMVAANSFSTTFAKAMLIATPPEFLCESLKPEPTVTPAVRKAIMDEETAGLAKGLRAVEDSYGTDVLNLIICCRFARRLLKNGAVKKYLAKNHPDILGELEQLLAEVEAEKLRKVTQRASQPSVSARKVA